jgi:hypothetical protein
MPQLPRSSGEPRPSARAPRSSQKRGHQIPALGPAKHGGSCGLKTKTKNETRPPGGAWLGLGASRICICLPCCFERSRCLSAQRAPLHPASTSNPGVAFAVVLLGFVSIAPDISCLCVVGGVSRKDISDPHPGCAFRTHISDSNFGCIFQTCVSGSSEGALRPSPLRPRARRRRRPSSPILRALCQHNGAHLHKNVALAARAARSLVLARIFLLPLLPLLLLLLFLSRAAVFASCIGCNHISG